MGLIRATRSVCLVLAFSSLSVACGSEGTSDSEALIRINELQSSNTVVEDSLGKKPDWIELYNMGSESVDLAGYFLSDDETALNKFTFTTGAVIAPGGMLVVWAAGADNVVNGPLYVGFKLSATDGDRIILSDREMFVVDSVEFTAPAAPDLAYARFPDGTGEFAWCAKETHGALNGAACAQ